MVTSVEGRFAWVRRQPRACGGCASAGGCSSGVLARALGGMDRPIRVRNAIQAGRGDAVVIAIEEGALLRASAAVYLVPIVAMLCGAYLGERLLARSLPYGEEMLGVLMGLAGLLAGLTWARHFGRQVAANNGYQPVILRRLDDNLIR